MKIGLYAGSFDPWSIGHQYVLDKAIDVFKTMHVLVAVNPSKKSCLEADDRARLVAHAVDPTTNWWDVEIKQPLTLKDNRLTVTVWDGLVADYAQRHDIKHFVRGIRSTTGFEEEFSLYFANYAINPSLQTWAIMCPPKLLHCSSTYIRTVVGNPCVKSVGASFAAQALMLKRPVIVGQIFDLYYFALQKEAKSQLDANILIQLQEQFTTVVLDKTKINALNITHLQGLIFQKNQNLQNALFYEEILFKI